MRMAPKAITLEMLRGRPVRDSSGKTRVAHMVSKLKWTLLGYGISWGDTATPP